MLINQSYQEVFKNDFLENIFIKFNTVNCSLDNNKLYVEIKNLENVVIENFMFSFSSREIKITSPEISIEPGHSVFLKCETETMSANVVQNQ